MKVKIYYYCYKEIFTGNTSTYTASLLSCDALLNKLSLLWWKSRSMLLWKTSSTYKAYIINHYLFILFTNKN